MVITLLSRYFIFFWEFIREFRRKEVRDGELGREMLLMSCLVIGRLFSVFCSFIYLFVG